MIGSWFILGHYLLLTSFARAMIRLWMASTATPQRDRDAVFVREYGLDALRVFAFLVLILYHSGMAFVSWDWHLKNAEKSAALEYIMLFTNRWRLPLLFFISGAGCAFSLRKRSLGQFSGERITRLLIPLVVGMFIVVPPQIYLERLQHGADFRSYLDFYRTVFQLVPYPEGSFSWHHLWFVAYVLVYALASIPLFGLLRSKAGTRTVGALANCFERWPWTIYLVSVPNLLAAMILGPHWPTTHNLVADWANLTGSWLTFLWGFIFASDRRLLDIVTRRRREFLLLGIAIAAAFFSIRATAPALPPVVSLITGNLISGYFGMAWIFALIGYARAKIMKGSAVLRYMNEGVYPFYIIHQTIAVAIVYQVIRWQMGVWPKFAVVAAGTVAGSWLFFEIVRRVTPLRPLFGLRLRNAGK